MVTNSNENLVAANQKKLLEIELKIIEKIILYRLKTSRNGLPVSELYDK